MRKHSKNKARASGRLRLGISLAALAVCLAAAGAGLFLAGRGADTTVARINGLPVDVREYQLLAQEERADVLADLTARWGVEADAGFWQTQRDGITPAAELERRTLERLTEIKVAQQLLLEAGLLEDAGYAAFHAEWQEENRRRQEALARGEVLYGPEAYTEKQYYTLRLDKGLLALQEQLAAGELAVTREERLDFYETGTESFLFENGTHKPLEQVQDVIDRRLVEAKFHRLVEERAENADVILYRHILDRIRYT